MNQPVFAPCHCGLTTGNCSCASQPSPKPSPRAGKWVQASQYRPCRGDAGVYMVRMNPDTAPGPNSDMYLAGNRRRWDGKTWRAGWTGQEVSVFGQHPSHEWFQPLGLSAVCPHGCVVGELGGCPECTPLVLKQVGSS